MGFRCAVGPVVQHGKTLPSRGKDRRFESGSAHFFGVFLLYGWVKRFIKSGDLRYADWLVGLGWKEILAR